MRDKLCNIIVFPFFLWHGLLRPIQQPFFVFLVRLVLPPCCLKTGQTECYYIFLATASIPAEGTRNVANIALTSRVIEQGAATRPTFLEDPAIVLGKRDALALLKLVHHRGNSPRPEACIKANHIPHCLESRVLKLRRRYAAARPMNLAQGARQAGQNRSSNFFAT